MRRTRSIVSLLALLAAALSAPQAALAQPGAAGIGKVVELTPPAEVTHAGATAAEPLAKGAALRLGDSLRTGAGGRVKMSFDDKSVLILAENSGLEITRHVYDPAARSRESAFKLYEGKVRAIVGELFGAASEFRVESPTGVAGVKGTDFEEHYKKPCTTVYTHAGAVDARNADPAVKGEVIVQEGESTTICEGQPPTRPKKAGKDLDGQLIDLRASETIHPPNFANELGGETKQPNVQLPPDYPTEIVNQPPDTGGLPPGPPGPPEPPKNP
jgi:ferric-dicitrate binding protein FerR (iron transport regulator)